MSISIAGPYISIAEFFSHFNPSQNTHSPVMNNRIRRTLQGFFCLFVCLFICLLACSSSSLLLLTVFPSELKVRTVFPVFPGYVLIPVLIVCRIPGKDSGL